MGTHEIPVLIQILLRHFPEQVGIADRGKNIMGFHSVIPIIGAQLQEFRQIPVPGVQIDRSRSLSHAQLIHRDVYKRQGLSFVVYYCRGF